MNGKQRIKRFFYKFTLFTFFMFALLLTVAWFVGSYIIQPWPTQVGQPPEGFPAVSISLKSENGFQLAGWHVRSNEKNGVIVLIHSTRQSRVLMLNRARFLYEAGYSIVMIDLQAQGESEGDNLTFGYLEQEDVKAAIGFAKEYHPDEPVGLIRVSLGAAATVYALPLEIDALVLDSCYHNMESAVHNRVSEYLGPLSYIPAELLLIQLEPRFGVNRDYFRPIDSIDKTNAPVFIIAGMNDKQTPAIETNQLYDRISTSKKLWLVEDVVHQDLFTKAPDEYKKRVLEFFAEHLKR